jgi:bifunctional ADP-heptose synthase (sugar kinase/adenylyltransferase)
LPPRELNRLDSKNWSPTAEALQEELVRAIAEVAERVEAIIVMDQVDLAETGVVTAKVRNAIHAALVRNPKLVVIADSRQGPANFPPVGLKMNVTELALLSGEARPLALEEAKQRASALARRNRQPVFVTLSERGIVGAEPSGECEHASGFPVRGPIDVVGAGDAVTASLTAALAAGASTGEAMSLAMAAASIVIHQLGTTGTATVEQIAELLRP